MTIVEMLEQSAARYPDKPAFLFRDTVVTYRDFHRQACVLAAFLHLHGLHKGDRVAILLEKSPESMVAFLGIAMAGGVAYTIDYNHTPAGLQFVLDLTKPSAIVAGTSFLPLLSGFILACPEKRIIVVGDDASGRHTPWARVMAGGHGEPPRAATAMDDPVYLNFTSGTTGAPKAAVTTNANIYWNTRSSVEALRLTHDDVHLCMFPIFGHPHELYARPLYLGGTAVLLERIAPKAIAGAIAEHGVTCMMAVASLYQSMATQCEAQPFGLQPLRLAESGGMHVSGQLARRFRACFGLPIVPVWGSTETAGIAVATPPDEERRPGSMGRPCPYYEVAVVTEDGRAAAPGELGELRIRGPGVCSHYLGNPAETAGHMRDGWMHTGDVVSRDADGYLYFSGRRHGLMKVAGLKVFPGEIEEVLSAHPAVSEVAVVRALDQVHGEVPRAVIVLKPSAVCSEADIRQYCEGHLARYKIPRLIEFTEALPKSASGKILHRKLETSGAPS